MQYLIWVMLSVLFYVVCYLAVLNILDDFTKNNPLKIPAMLMASVPAAFLMAILGYRPIFLFALTSVANYYRVQQIVNPKEERADAAEQPNPALFYSASYLYLVALCILAYYFQMPVEEGETSVPLWKTWFPEETAPSSP